MMLLATATPIQLPQQLDFAAEPERLSTVVQLALVMTVLAVLPSILVMFTSFVRFIVVFHFLRQALGTQSFPPNQVLAGLALMLTFFVMAPVIDEIHLAAAKPYMDGQISAEVALENGIEPLKKFMLNQTRDSDLQLFASIAGRDDIDAAEHAPMALIVPSFMVSELKTAFQIGFLVFIPFLVIDLVVSSVLMSMGMMMLSPMLISLPFKIMLFVMVDGWALVLGTLASSFYA